MTATKQSAAKTEVKVEKETKEKVAETKKAIDEKVEETKESAAKAADETAQTATQVAEGVKETLADKKDQAVDAAKEAVDNVSTDDIQAKLDAAQKKATDALKDAGQTVKGGFADHGIDTDKLGAALKEDAKNAASAVVGAGKFAAEKIGNFVEDMKEKAAEADRDDQAK